MDEGLLRKCDQMLKGLMKRTQAVHFSKPVDWKKWGLHEYPRLIKQPMDLGTVQERLTRHHYARLEDMAFDCRLVWVREQNLPPHARALRTHQCTIARSHLQTSTVVCTHLFPRLAWNLASARAPGQPVVWTLCRFARRPRTRRPVRPEQV